MQRMRQKYNVRKGPAPIEMREVLGDIIVSSDFAEPASEATVEHTVTQWSLLEDHEEVRIALNEVIAETSITPAFESEDSDSDNKLEDSERIQRKEISNQLNYSN